MDIIEERFRFRAWNYSKKHYISQKRIKVLGLENLLKAKHVVVEQCTGLRDKNGTLIYEGDLVKWKNYDKYPYLTRVVWCQPLSCFDYVTEDHTWCTGTHLEPCFNCYIEVVGNIHEREKINK